MPKSNRWGIHPWVLIAAGLAVISPQAAYPWGQNGHRIVAELAERRVAPEVRTALAEILDGESLAQVSTWADDIRSFPPWDCAAPFHFVTIAPGTEYPGEGVPEGDAIAAVVYYADVVADRQADLESRRVALKFLVHLVGDLHQPLHVGRGCDRGGNLIDVEWFGESVNFHSVWDVRLIESEDLSFTELSDFIDRATAEEVAGYQESTPFDWAREAQELLDGIYSCDVRGDRCPCFCGGCEDGLSPFGGCVERKCTLLAAGPVVMSYQYKARNLPILRDQLVKGGARLAGMLSWILADDPTPPAAYQQVRETMHSLPNWPQARAALAGCDGSAEQD